MHVVIPVLPQEKVIDLTRFNKIATQGAPQMAVDKEANSLSRVYSYYSKFNLRLFYVSPALATDMSFIVIQKQG